MATYHEKPQCASIRRVVASSVAVVRTMMETERSYNFSFVVLHPPLDHNIPCYA